MEEIISIVKSYGIYIGLPVVIGFLTQGIKSQWASFFANNVGQRIIHFLPLILGIAGGLALPEQTWASKLFIGGALGALSTILYKTVTVTLAKSPAAIIEADVNDTPK